MTVGNTAGLSAERAITAGAGLTGTDGGANSTYTLAAGAGTCITANTDDVALSATCSQNQTWSGTATFSSYLAAQSVAKSTAVGPNVDFDIGSTSLVLMTCTAAGSTCTFSGFTGGVNGRIVTIHNVSAPTYDLLLDHENASSAAANRITGWQNEDTRVKPQSSVVIVYNGTTSRWVIAAQGRFADSFATNPGNCSAGAIPRGVDAEGTAEGCGAVLETEGGTGIVTYAQGDIIYSDATDNLAVLAAGSAGQLLRTGGAGANPSWVARPSTHVGYRSVGDTAVAKADGNATVTTLTNWNTTLDDLGAVTPVSLDGFANIRIIVRGNNTGGQSGTVTTEIWNYTTAAQLVQVTFTSTTIATYTNTAAIALTGVNVLGCRIKSSVATDDPQLALCAWETY